MTFSDGCGPHCIVRANAEDTVLIEAHCPGGETCGQECHADGDVSPSYNINRGRADAALPPRSIDGLPLYGIPMCDSWGRESRHDGDPIR